MTYLGLTAIFLAAAALIGLLALRAHRRSGEDTAFAWSAVCAAGLVLLVLTAVFDNIMIGVGLFTYAEAQISGVRLGLAPIEDFSYPLAAVILLPGLWMLFGTFGQKSSHR